MKNYKSYINFNIINSIIAISRIVEDSKLKEDYLIEVENDIANLSEYLGVDSKNAIIFCVIFVMNQNYSDVSVKDIIRYLDLKYADSLQIRLITNILLDNKLIKSNISSNSKKRHSLNNNDGFTIPVELSEAIFKNQMFTVNDEKPIDIYGFLSDIAKLINERNFDNLSTDDLFAKIAELEDKCRFDAIKNLLKNIQIPYRALLYYAADDIAKGYTATSLLRSLGEIFDSNRDKMLILKSLTNEASELQIQGLIRIEGGNLLNDSLLYLTEKAINDIFGNDAELYINTKKNRNLILPESIVSKELFFDDKLNEQLKMVTNSIFEENYVRLIERLKSKNLPTGLTVLLHGLPGTGKTESIYQIAKQTGRSLFVVDISNVKSKWFGESEKIIKEIFVSYQKASAKCTYRPILVINEADGILSKRKDVSSSNLAQTENAIQNILLEQIEQFDGILIATTNLVGNLDDAFDRRFLFKIKFEKPSIETLKIIWKSKLDWLNSYEVDFLVEKFKTISGAEIENVVRKVTLNEVIKGKSPSFENIVEFCLSEGGIKKMIPTIGY